MEYVHKATYLIFIIISLIVFHKQFASKHDEITLFHLNSVMLPNSTHYDGVTLNKVVTEKKHVRSFNAYTIKTDKEKEKFFGTNKISMRDIEKTYSLTDYTCSIIEVQTDLQVQGIDDIVYCSVDCAKQFRSNSKFVDFRFIKLLIGNKLHTLAFKNKDSTAAFERWLAGYAEQYAPVIRNDFEIYLKDRK